MGHGGYCAFGCRKVKHICVNSGQSIYNDRIPGDFHHQTVFEKLLKGDQVNLQAAQEHGKRSAVSLSDLGA